MGSPAPLLEVSFDLQAGGKKRGEPAACQMDAAQKSHLIYEGFGGLEEWGRKKRGGTEQAVARKN